MRLLFGQFLRQRFVGRSEQQRRWPGERFVKFIRCFEQQSRLIERLAPFKWSSIVERCAVEFKCGFVRHIRRFVVRCWPAIFIGRHKQLLAAGFVITAQFFLVGLV